MTKNKNKQYLGDSVYVNHDGLHYVLTTENGFGPSNTIMLEDSVLDSLIRYSKQLNERLENERQNADNK